MFMDLYVRCVIPLDSYPFLGSRDPVVEDRCPQDHSTLATLLMSMSRPVHSPAPGHPERMVQQRYTVEENIEARDGERHCLSWMHEQAITKATQKGVPRLEKQHFNGAPPNYEGGFKEFLKQRNIKFSDFLEYNLSTTDGDWNRYSYKPSNGGSHSSGTPWKARASVGANRVIAYAGTTWYAFASMVASGILVPSFDATLGHGMLLRPGGGYYEGCYFTPDFRTAAVNYATFMVSSAIMLSME